MYDEELFLEKKDQCREREQKKKKKNEKEKEKKGRIERLSLKDTANTKQEMSSRCLF